MWKDVVKLIKNAPRHYFRVHWVPSHLTDEVNDDRLNDYLESGGSLQMAHGNAVADKLADAGTDLLAPTASVLR